MHPLHLAALPRRAHARAPLRRRRPRREPAAAAAAAARRRRAAALAPRHAPHTARARATRHAHGGCRGAGATRRGGAHARRGDGGGDARVHGRGRAGGCLPVRERPSAGWSVGLGGGGIGRGGSASDSDRVIGRTSPGGVRPGTASKETLSLPSVTV
eukprot:scaffold35051_cov65-Phaeocystis_antarctica.AAC.7